MFEQVIGIDLGTEHTVVVVKGKEIILREQSVVATEPRTGRFQAFGSEANEMLGRTPSTIRAFHPLERGVIADYAAATKMLAEFLQRVIKKSFSFSRRPRVVISVPSCATPVEKRAVEDAVKEAGAKTAVTIEAGMAAAIGAGLPVGDASGSMIVDIGAGTTEVAVVALGGIVASTSLRVGGRDLDAAIVRHIRQQHDLMIGDATAESIKVKIGAARKSVDPSSIHVSGRNLRDGLPRSAEVTSTAIVEAIAPSLDQILGAIRRTLEKVPGELAADLFDRGIVLCGGTAQLTNLNSMIASATGLSVVVADSPMDCVALGTAQALDEVFQRQSRVHLKPAYI